MRARAFGIAIICTLSVVSIWSLARHSLFFAANPPHPNDAPVETLSYESLREAFRNPPSEYGIVDGWWWEAGHLNKDKLRWELEELKDKGIAGPFLYPRFLYNEPLRSDPAYWSEGWWDLVRFTMQESQRLGLISWFSNWEAQQFIQNRIRLERKENTALTGRRLAAHEKESKGPGPLEIAVADDEQILYAGAYKESGGGLDYSSRKDLRGGITGHKLKWSADRHTCD